MRKVFNTQNLLWIALVLALVGSLRHVAWGFATLEQGDMYSGYVQAVAVDLGLFSLAFGVQQRRRQRRTTWTLWLGVVLFSGISTYANLLHGLVHQSAIGLDGWMWLVGLRPVLLSGVLPLLVLYLSEIVSSDIQHVQVQEERARKAEQKKAVKPSNTAEIDSTTTPIEQARAVKREQDADDKAATLDAMLDIYRTNPKARASEVAQAVQKSRTTVYTYLRELERAGRISRNGEGVKVLERRVVAHGTPNDYAPLRQ